MASFLNEKKTDPTFIKLIAGGASPYQTPDSGGMDFQQKHMLKHRSRSAVTDWSNIPGHFMHHSRQSTFRKMRDRATMSRDPTAFTPRFTDLDNQFTTRDMFSDAQGNIKDHYTPNWFKISIRTVDRDKLLEADPETKLVTVKVQEICRLRDKYLYKPTHSDHIGCILQHREMSVDVLAMKDKLPKSIDDKYECKFEKGIMRIISKNSNRDIYEYPSFDEYQEDLQKVMNLVSFGPAKTLCYRRLKILHSRFILHQWLNDHVEVLEVKAIPHRDFYNVRKIDNHVHHSACMHQKHLLRFIKRKLRKEADTIVFKKKDGTKQSLSQVFQDIGMTGHELNIDALDMHAHQETFQRFDKFNAKYNPVGKAQLRTIFLKIDNLINGRYLAEITKEVALDLEDSRYQFAEYRVSIYGKKKEEWDVMGDWICNNNLYSNNIRWLIQMPRIYNIFKKIGLPAIKTFNDMMDNFFSPLFEVTLNPSSHPSLHLFLHMVVGFDSVDDESQPEQKHRKYPNPSQWKMKENPPYTYYLYYIWVNVCKLNRLREERGMNVFALRPHCGEAGGFDHLGSAFLLANSINHGIRLKQAPVLQYLYYLKQIGLAMSPLSNNILFEEYDSNPLPAFFKRGLNVALSTDDPLLIHYTKDALLEEYSIAAQVYNLSSIDLCELARNSVIQCGWDKSFKEHCIGRKYHLQGAEGNNIYQSNVPDARLDFRASLLREENNFIIHAGYPQDLMRKHSLNSAFRSHGSVQYSDEENIASTQTPEEKDDDQDAYAQNMAPKPRISTLLQHSMMQSMQFVTRTKSKYAQFELADNVAGNKGYDVSKAPPHEEWVQLAQEEQRIQSIHDALLKFIDRNKQSGSRLEGYSDLEKIISKHINSPRLLQSNTSGVASPNLEARPSLLSLESQDSADADDRAQIISTIMKESIENLQDVAVNKQSTSRRRNTQDLEKATKKLYKENKTLSEDAIADIRGLYFDDTDSLNEIDKKFNVKLGTENDIVFTMKPSQRKKRKDHKVLELEVDLVESKQEHILDEAHCDRFLVKDELEDKKQIMIHCELDPRTGELIWNSGEVWYKKEWKLLVGAWSDPENNLIEIRADNTLRYIDGYGPFGGEFTGFQKLHVQMPNDQFMEGSLLGTKEIKWENEEKWVKCSDKGCLIM